MFRDGLKGVFFDAGGTLITPNPSLGEIYSRVLAPLGIRIDAAGCRRAAQETWAEFNDLVGRGKNRYAHFPGGESEYWRRYVRCVLERVSAAERAEEAAAALHRAFSDPAIWSVFPEVRSTLRVLKGAGLRLGVISNWDSRLRSLLDALDLLDEFETIVVSSEVGVEKPERAIFERALGELGLAPHEAFHVGDDPVSDYEGPLAAGIDAALLVRRGPPPPGVASLGRLDGLVALLGPAGGRP